MININNNFTVDEFVKINYLLKKKIRIIFAIISLVSFICAVSLFAAFMSTSNDILNIFGAVSVFFFIFFGYYAIRMNINTFKKNILKFNPRLENGINYEYSFNDNEMNVISKTDNASTKATFKYDSIIKTFIIEDYIYIQVTENLSYPIKKNELTEEELSNLKQLLKF